MFLNVVAVWAFVFEYQSDIDTFLSVKCTAFACVVRVCICVKPDTGLYMSSERVFFCNEMLNKMLINKNYCSGLRELSQSRSRSRLRGTPVTVTLK